MKERYDDLDEYIADLRAEISANPTCANHYYNLGVALLSKRDFVAAEECFLNALRQSAHLAEAYVQLGGICLERGDLQGCLRYNEEAAGCRAKFPIPQSNIGFVHLQLGDPAKAIHSFEKALKWDPEFIQARNGLATAFFMEGSYDACIRECQHILEKEEGFGPAWNNMALAYAQKGEYDKAIQAVDKALACGFDVHKQFLEELAPYRA